MESSKQVSIHANLLTVDIDNVVYIWHGNSSDRDRHYMKVVIGWLTGVDNYIYGHTWLLC